MPLARSVAGEGEASRFLRVFRKNRDARVRVLLSIVAPCEGRLDLTPSLKRKGNQKKKTAIRIAAEISSRILCARDEIRNYYNSHPSR